MRHLPLVLLFLFVACGWISTAPAQPQNPGFFGRMIRQAPEPSSRSEPPQARAEPQARSGRGANADREAEQLYRTGRRYIEQGYYSEGLEALNQSIALRPQFARAHTYKGIALRALREPRLALQHFDEALAIDPEDGVAHGERGLTHIVLGDEEKARADLRTAQRLRPDLQRWFSDQTEWMAANRQSLVRDSSEVAPGETPAPAATPVPTETAEDAEATAADDTATADSEGFSFRSLFYWLAILALAIPAIIIFVAFLIFVVLLRLTFAITSAIFRAFTRPSQPRLPAPGRPTSSFPPLPADGHLRPGPHPHAPVPVAAPRPSFRRRHRGFLITAAAGLAVMFMVSLPVLVQAFRLDADQLTAPEPRPTVLDFRGNVYTRLGAPVLTVTFEDLPTHLVDALRAREDARFFEHSGVDWYGLARAVVANATHFRIKQGASTLTMQLVEKAYTLPQDGLLQRVKSKLVEWTMAHRGEAALARKLGDRRAAKEAIMTAYLNRVEFGGGTVGVGSASQYYFEKPVSELTLGESCMLVALLRAPTANSPYRNPDNAREARDKIVVQMLRRGYITEEQAKQARFYVVDNPRPPQPKHNSYLVAAITREMNHLKAAGKLPDDVWDKQDLTIQSTLDLWAQDILDSEVRKVVTSYKGDTEKDPLLGAGIIVDNATGQIRALVSGQEYSRSQYDLALVSRRQVASIAKPFVYGTWIEQGGDMEQVTSNGPLTAKEVKALGGWNPDNASALDPGNHSLARGLAFSDNLITVRVGLTAGLKRVYSTLNSAGLISDKATTGPAWMLGTFEASLADVISAYSAIPRGGTRTEPYLVQSVSIDGKEIFRATPQSQPLFSQRTSQQLHRALRLGTTEGTGRRAMSSAGVEDVVAGKTGTSQKAADVWWVGYVKDLTLGVRFGRDSNASLGNAAGGTMAAPVAATVLKKLGERYRLADVSPTAVGG